MNDGKSLTIVKNLQTLGIKPDTTSVYIGLAKVGASSALLLAKRTGITRTQIYRHLEQLQNYGLVSAERLSYGTLFRALPLENIEGLIASRKAEADGVKQNLGLMVELMHQLVGGDGSKATVQHYYGVDGLKQVNWNLTKADKEYRVFEVAHLSSSLDKTFARRCHERYIERGLTSYDLTNSTTIDAAEIEPCDPTREFFRYIDPATLSINFETYIYNDVVALLDYSKGRQMAIEIHHPALNTMMTQLFNVVWAQATPLKIHTQKE